MNGNGRHRPPASSDEGPEPHPRRGEIVDQSSCEKHRRSARNQIKPWMEVAITVPAATLARVATGGDLNAANTHLRDAPPFPRRIEDRMTSRRETRTT